MNKICIRCRAEVSPWQSYCSDECYILKHVDECGADECWPWLGPADQGRPKAYLPSGGNRTARREVYKLFTGEAVGKGACVGGTCASRMCVNPAHAVIRKRRTYTPPPAPTAPPSRVADPAIDVLPPLLDRLPKPVSQMRAAETWLLATPEERAEARRRNEMSKERTYAEQVEERLRRRDEAAFADPNSPESIYRARMAEHYKKRDAEKAERRQLLDEEGSDSDDTLAA